MNNKGFTLVEVLGTLALLAVVGVVAGKFFTKNADVAKKTISDSQKNSILNAAEQWSIENTALLDENDVTSEEKNATGSITEVLNHDDIKKCITTNYLYEKGYLNTKDIKLENNEKFSGYIIISWDEKNNQYKFRLANTDKEISSCQNHLVNND